MPDDPWDDIPLQPLTGKLDTRSRPADLAPGEFRYKLNMLVSKTGKMGRRAGYGALYLGPVGEEDEELVANWDFHRQDAEREFFNMLFESSDPNGINRLFAGTQSRISVMDNTSSEWTHIATGKGAEGTIWKAAELRDRAYFTNDHDEPLTHVLGSGVVHGISELAARGTTKARLVVQFGGQILWMNLEENGERFGSRIRWSNNNDGTQYDPSFADTVASFQDLDYGDDILNAVEMAGALYIFTAQSIWRCTISVTEDTIYAFTRIYSDPKNQTGCLVYPNTLVSDGRSAFWLSKESAYTINPYLAQPKSTDDFDWLLKGTGLVFEGAARIDPSCCQRPIGHYSSDSKEVYFFYPRLNRLDQDNCINDFGVVLNTQFNTADHVDYGMTAMTSFRRAPTAQTCEAAAVLIGASGKDWCLKSIGTVFAHEDVVTGVELENDIADVAYSVLPNGYFSIVRGMCPFGFPNGEKIVRSLLLEHDTTDAISEEPNLIKLRIGNSFVLQDPNSNGERCGVLWHEIKLINADGVESHMPLQCPDEAELDEMADQNLRPSDSTEWEMWEAGRYLYYELTVTNNDGDAPINGDSMWNRLNFSVRQN